MSKVSIEFKLPWVAVTEEKSQRLEAELTQEICFLHHLAIVDRRVIARRVDTDDILVEIAPHLSCASVPRRI